MAGAQAAGIQTRITALEAKLATIDAETISADGASKSGPSRKSLVDELNAAYVQLARCNGTSPMFVRTRMDNLGVKGNH